MYETGSLLGVNAQLQRVARTSAETELQFAMTFVVFFFSAVNQVMQPNRLPQQKILNFWSIIAKHFVL